MGCNCNGWPVEDVALSETVMVEVPEGVMTGGGVVTAALPPPQPTRASGIKKIAAERTPQRARELLRVARWKARRFLLKSVKEESRSRKSKIATGRGTREMGGTRNGPVGGNWAGPLVVTVTLNIAAPLASETLAGTWQTAARGAPLQLSETVPVNPAPGVS